LEDALQYTHLAVNIIIILLFLGLVVLVFKLLGSVKLITEKFEKLSTDVKDLKPKVETTVEKINSLSDNVNLLVTKFNGHAEKLGTVVDRIKETADSIIDFEQELQRKIEPPVLDTVNTISAVSIGIKTFFEKLTQKRPGKIEITDDEYEDIKDSMNEVNHELEEVNSKLTDLQR